MILSGDLPSYIILKDILSYYFQYLDSFIYLRILLLLLIRLQDKLIFAKSKLYILYLLYDNKNYNFIIFYDVANCY